MAVPTGHGGRQSFLEKTLESTAAIAGELFFSDILAGRDGFFQRFDPRGRLLTVLALLVTVSLARSPLTVWGIYPLTILLALASGGLGGPFRCRLWLAVPLYAALLTLPATCNIIIPGEPLWVLARLGEGRAVGPWQVPAEIAVTRQGLQMAFLFVGRVAASVALASLLALTTTWSRILQAFRLFRVPPLFILTLTMTYRYVALLVRVVAELHTARKSRTVRYLAAGAERRWVAARLGYLFGKSYRLAREVHGAMVARGFAGEVSAQETGKLRGGDVAWLLLVLVSCAAVLIVERRP
jgi:cobalt/nickel transport system permease protein